MLKEQNTGYTNAEEFRASNLYNDTEQLFIEHGLTNIVENRTPPVCVNIAHLSTMDSVQGLQSEFLGRTLNVAVLGISSARGPKDLQDLLKSLGASHISTTALDISDGIFAEVEATGLDKIQCLQRDARDTRLSASSQDLVLRDHLGNCCPPAIDRAINREVARILKPNAISIVNITTSELLAQSAGRKTIKFDELINLVGNDVICALQEQIYDLDDLKKNFPSIDSTILKGPILEIEPNNSFVVFGEEAQGHGEWFRSLNNHLAMFEADGFEILATQSREGWDSHIPPLRCQRHNVVLRKII